MDCTRKSFVLHTAFILWNTCIEEIQAGYCLSEYGRVEFRKRVRITSLNGLSYEVNVRVLLKNGGTRWRSWLRHCTTSRKVAGSVPDGVIGIFYTDRTLVLGSTQPHNSNKYQEYVLGVKGGPCVGLRTLPSPGAECL